MKKFIKVIVLAMAFVLVFATLASCGKSIDSITKKAEKEGYAVEEYKESQLSRMNMDLVVAGVDGEITAAIEIEKETDDDFFWADVYEFDKASAAKKFVELSEEEAADEDLVIERSGKVVIVGDKEIVEAIW